MLKRKTIYGLLVSFALLSGCGGSDKGSNEVDANISEEASVGYVIIENSTNSIESIKEIYFKAEDHTTWGQNLLEKMLSPDQNKVYQVNECNKNYSIKAVYENDKDLSWKEVNLKCNEQSKVSFVLYQSSIPEENIDCSMEGQSKMLYDIMKDTYFWYNKTPDLNYEAYDDLSQLLEDLKYKKYDRWSYITTPQAYQEYFEEGTYRGLGFGLGFFDNRLYINLVYPNSPADKAGLKRGVEILEINGKTIDEIYEEELWGTIMGEDKEGVEVALKVNIDATVHDLRLKKALIAKKTVLGTKVLSHNGKKVGYLNFVSFIEPSRDELAQAFAQFKEENIDELVLDLRYNSGGRLDVARYLASLIGGEKTNGKIFETVQHNEKFSHWDYSFRFTNELSALNLSQLYVLTTNLTASSSEAVINGLKPFINVHLLGSNTHGKPVGMYGYDFCDQHVSPIMIKGVNANEEGDYFSGLPAICQVDDDITKEFGDQEEKMLKEALYYLENGACLSKHTTTQQSKMYQNRKRTEEIYQGFRREVGAF